MASHIVGGEMTYRCLGVDQYEITLDLYRDCLHGEPSAISEDEPVYLGIYRGDGSLYKMDTSVFFIQKIEVPANFSNECVTGVPPHCLQRARARRTYSLPSSPSGYRIVYQRCCRNNVINNILNPGNTGATYACTIPPSGTLCNNSAVFKNYPPQIICINTPLTYDHAATDADGDSLSYAFCMAYQGGSTSDAKPFPLYAATPVDYVSPFTFQKPMLGNPLVQINPATGLITGTPNLAGIFVVAVCCYEWRDGAVINTVTREFQFEVTNCSKAVVANIPQWSSEFNTYLVKCDNYTVHFVNQSSGGFKYDWDFGVEGSGDDVSHAFEPDFTYPDTGTYQVKLVVNAGTTCPDSITRLVKIYPILKANFTTEGLLCPNDTLHFVDQTFSTYQPIESWEWHFGDGTQSNDQNTWHLYPAGGEYPVSLIAKNSKGCIDTVTQTLGIERFRPFAGNDTIIVKGERIDFRATGGVVYVWSPADFLDVVNTGSPSGFYPDTGHYAYQVFIQSANGCEGYDSIQIWVVGQPALFVPTAFSPNGDGKNDVLKPTGIGYREIEYFRVFDRWGEKVFDTSHFGEGWNGNFKGQPAGIGTYFWVLKTVDRFGKEAIISGDAILVR